MFSKILTKYYNTNKILTYLFNNNDFKWKKGSGLQTTKSKLGFTVIGIWI